MNRLIFAILALTVLALAGCTLVVVTEPAQGVTISECYGFPVGDERCVHVEHPTGDNATTQRVE